MPGSVNSNTNDTTRVNPHVQTGTQSGPVRGNTAVTIENRGSRGENAVSGGDESYWAGDDSPSIDSYWVPAEDDSWAREAAERAEQERKERESENKRRQDDADRRAARIGAMGRVAQLSGADVARASSLASQKDASTSSGRKASDSVNSDSPLAAQAGTTEEDRIMSQIHDAVEARDAARRGRNQLIEDSFMSQVHDAVDRRNAASARRAAQEETAAERSARRNVDIEDSVMADAHAAVAARNAAEARKTAQKRIADAIQDARKEIAAERSARNLSDMEDAILSDVLTSNYDEYDARSQYDKEIGAEARARLNEINRQRQLAQIKALLDQLPDDILEQLAESDIDLNELSYEEIVKVLERLLLDNVPEVPSRGELIAERVPEPRMSTSEYYRNYVDSTNQMIEEQAEAEGINTESREYRRQVLGEESGSIDRPNSDDTLWTEGYDVTGMKPKKARRFVEKMEADRTRQRYLDAKQSPGDVSFDADEPESSFMRKMRKLQNRMILRWKNPSLVHIASERIETYTKEIDGKEHTFARRVYDSERVRFAIEKVRDMYDCSISDVMQLIQARGGIGIDMNGTIAGVDPNKFELTDDQAYELLRDIVTSQRLNGHPLGPVEGMPRGSGVRDDTGRFVVVAGTRCFPLGYMPKDLIRSLSRNHGSELHGLTEQQIQQRVAETWINQTYPQLCANTGGNLMYQARAIENMVRALASMDGTSVSDLDIPDVVERRTLMQMRAEQQMTEDDAIRQANEVKHDRTESALDEWRNINMKQGRTRRSDGSIGSVSKRRRNKGGDFFRTLSSLERSAKAANIMVMISSIPEAWVANREQSLANWLSEAAFKSSRNGDSFKYYEVTDRLSALSESNDAVEALTIAESLYRIGGHVALDAFLTELDDSGFYRNRMTKKDLREFLERWGVTGDSITDELKERLGLRTKGDISGFLSNVSAVLDGAMLGSGMFRDGESRQFVRMSMAEMARASVHGRESYTSKQVEQWGQGGGEELIRSLLQTDAGREAFMTQGITSLGRKSPVEHMMRSLMSRNGLTEFAVRTMFDRFPEYGVNKVLQMMPMSNTLCYLASRGISSMGDLLVQASADAPSNFVSNAAGRLGEGMSRVLDYQAGGRLSFAEGLRKNLMYDCIMGGEKILIAGVYAAVIAALGGVQPPDDERDRYNWSEWKIGSGDDAVPIKWAWWMDDLSGVGLPLGMAWAICEQGGWSDEAKSTATNTFINAVANLNSGTAVFDFIDLVNNFDQEAWAALDTTGSYEPSRDEWLMTALEQGVWDMVGDLTPTFVGQIVPWSKDYLLRGGDQDAHTASKVYDTSGKSKAEATEAQTTDQVGSYSDYMRRRSTQSNVLYAMFMDWITGASDDESDLTGYKYTEQPLDTMVDPYAQKMFDRFFLDLDPATTNIPPSLPEDERKALLYDKAEEVVQWIDDHYTNPTQAALDGFVLNYDARVNCINYCHDKINQAWQNYYDSLDNGWLDDDEYQQVLDDRKNAIDHYNNLIYNFFQSKEIGWSLPRYVRQESDRETRYVDEQGNPMTYVDTLPTSVQRIFDNVTTPLFGSLELGPRSTTGAGANEESYWYGNRSNVLPFYSPVTEGKGRNYETIPYNIVLDEDGNPVNDVGAMYDNAATMDAIKMGRLEGRDVQELMWGGQGNNMKDDVSEELRIPREGVPTLGGSSGSGGGRPWRLLESSVPDELGLGSLDADAVSKRLGITSSLPTDGKYAAQKANESSQTSGGGGGGSYYSGGGSYYSGGGNYYSGGGGGGSYASAYNPKIYASSRQVNGDRASGMRTMQPYKPTTTYLRPAFYTIGSREAYRRQQ